ncbi:DUF2953 domain-containing protein [Clostridium sp.]|uniref:DUF2953 domain-containing protein n=1 Tax=Clostridium sp. TaxID=1506 RepID=UPI00284F031D|nr:DUF2953 domain-containing protein [Clostridium sp.]MDR3596714.1 DUF2953 domain-containing protein [Clostridium sp.]
MKLFLIMLGILLIFFIPIPIKFSIYYSAEDYYIKLYKIVIVSKKKDIIKKDIIKKDIKYKSEPEVKDKFNLLSFLYKNINLKSFLSNLYRLKFKPLLRIKFSLHYSFNDAAKTAVSYGVLCQLPQIIFLLSSIPFNVRKFDFKINPIFEDKFLLKFETSSIIFLSLANIIYMIIILLKYLTD